MAGEYGALTIGSIGNQATSSNTFTVEPRYYTTIPAYSISYGWQTIGAKTISSATLSELMLEVVARLQQNKADREVAKQLGACLKDFLAIGENKELPATVRGDDE